MTVASMYFATNHITGNPVPVYQGDKTKPVFCRDCRCSRTEQEMLPADKNGRRTCVICKARKTAPVRPFLPKVQGPVYPG
jgi:hypothetical protein